MASAQGRRESPVHMRALTMASETAFVDESDMQVVVVRAAKVATSAAA